LCGDKMKKIVVDKECELYTYLRNNLMIC